MFGTPVAPPGVATDAAGTNQQHDPVHRWLRERVDGVARKV
jgi:hypothetical protein